jgi:hypothetical protein
MAITVRNLGVEERSGDCFFPRNWTETFALEDNLAERECESLELGCREEEVELQRVDREEDAIAPHEIAASDAIGAVTNMHTITKVDNFKSPSIS